MVYLGKERELQRYLHQRKATDILKKNNNTRMSVQKTEFERELDEIMMLSCRLNNLVDRAYQYEVGYD
jgi:hypothetical protein